MSTTKECDMCFEHKTLDNFYLIKGTPRSKCKVCYCKKSNSNPNHLIQVKKYYESNREQRVKAMRIYQIKNKTGVELVY
jgi:hypothetical protein